MTRSRCPGPTGRRFVQQLGAASVLALAPHATGNLSRPRPRVAAVFTEFRFRSHAYDILENFFSPYLFCGKLHDPGVDVVSFYADQFPQQDMAVKASRDHHVPLYDSIDKALCNLFCDLGTKRAWKVAG